MLNTTAKLCEACGYEVLGQGLDTVCPECAYPVVESLPEKRLGTPWQRQASLRSWACTVCGLIYGTKKLYRTMAAQSWNPVFPLINLSVFVILTGAFILWFPANNLYDSARRVPTSLLPMLVLTGWSLLLPLLTYLVFALPWRLRYGRIPFAWTRAIIWHASSAGIYAGITSLIFAILTYGVMHDADAGKAAAIMAGLFTGEVLFIAACSDGRKSLRLANLTYPDGTLVLPQPLP